MTKKPLQPLLDAREYDPFHVLGLHRDGSGWVLRAFLPYATEVAVEWRIGKIESLQRVNAAGIFEWRGTLSVDNSAYVLHVVEDGITRRRHDAYAFPPQPPAEDLYLFNEGRNCQAYRLLGAAPEMRGSEASDWIGGVRFRVWAPNAERVSVVGVFNRWDGRVHQMASLGASGVWELFIPHLVAGDLYKFEIRNRQSGAIAVKADPYARCFEQRPATAACVSDGAAYAWGDGTWIGRRAMRDWLHAPMSIYEVHAGSWMRHVDGSFYSYRELAERLIPYVCDLGYTHVEFMPLMEHPLDESWGYQCTGHFAPTSRFGTADDLRYLINACHQVGLGVILDWVPGHFPTDAFALAHFDGSPLYEHADPRLKLQPDWGTYVFNFGRNEVRSFLLSSAHYWLAEFHADGLRVDAVASMLYLDYSRKPGEWLPNRHGGRENLEAIQFLQELNAMVHREFPGALTIAEESTSWPMVSRPVHLGGLGFSMKWNMGWMNDTLDYIENDPVHRRYHHDRLTFGQLYAYTENFVLPLSHDEVVHGKRSLLGKMPGDDWQRFANLRLLLAYQYGMPGKKLGFMGSEIAAPHEWRSSEELPWRLLAYPAHTGMQRLMRDLNRLHAQVPALHELDFSPDGFSWIDCHDSDQSVVSWLRFARDGSCVAIVCNFTPVPRHGYRIGVPGTGVWRELLNTDSEYFGGGNLGNGSGLNTEAQPWMQRPALLTLTVPPLAVVFLTPA
ncbi:MAG TPA: 1,4-alpha-glucan branching protein GlgB [Rhodocyclaceae bacterium]|nr:1,4-alpha-glucan branching protein GlgB [Rhodocyclaceae bacterium]